MRDIKEFWGISNFIIYRLVLSSSICPFRSLLILYILSEALTGNAIAFSV